LHKYLDSGTLCKCYGSSTVANLIASRKVSKNPLNRVTDNKGGTALRRWGMNLAKPLINSFTAVALLTGLSHILPLRSAEAAWSEVPLSQIEVTEGAAEVRQLASGLIEVTGARFRATERGYTAVAAQLAFGYRGEAENGEPLEGGEFRIQIGQKLLSADPCNLVYVIWRLYPTESIVVSVKRNPEEHTSAECGNRGYTNVVPSIFPPGATTASQIVPAVLSARTGVTRRLASTYDDRSRTLIVTIDDQLVWKGRLSRTQVHLLSGPAGVRTDNGQFRFRFYTWK
jgi:hypothetical protein